MLKSLEKAIYSKSINKSKCIILANYKNLGNVQNRNNNNNISTINNPISTQISIPHKNSMINKIESSFAPNNHILNSLLGNNNHQSLSKSPHIQSKENQELRHKNFESLKAKANQHEIKIELFDISRLSVNFKEDSNNGFSSNSTEFESYLAQILLS